MSILRTKITNSLFCFWKCFKFDAYIQLNRYLYNEYDYSKTSFEILYASMVTSLCERQGIIERIQHRFTRMFPELRKLPYLRRLECLKLWTLVERRARADLIEVYKSNLRHHFFSERIINNCNNLDNKTVTPGSINIFKGNLERLRQSKR